MKRFILRRLEDVTGVSGVGIVVQGVQFDDGACAIRWVSEYGSTTHHDSIENVVAVHGHGGKTVLEWVDGGGARGAELAAYQAGWQDGARWKEAVLAEHATTSPP